MKKINDYLISANFAVLLVYAFVFQQKFNNASIKILVLISFIVLALSMFGLVWYYFRYPKRKKILDDLNNKTRTKIADSIATVIENIFVPFARADVRAKELEKLLSIKSEKEYIEYQKNLKKEIKKLEGDLKNIDNGEKTSGTSKAEEKAIRGVVESFMQNVAYESRDNFNTAFKKPLNEKNAQAKHVTDLIFFKIRFHLFIMGCVIVMSAIIFQILLG